MDTVVFPIAKYKADSDSTDSIDDSKDKMKVKLPHFDQQSNCSYFLHYTITSTSHSWLSLSMDKNSSYNSAAVSTNEMFDNNLVIDTQDLKNVGDYNVTVSVLVIDKAEAPYTALDPPVVIKVPL